MIKWALAFTTEKQAVEEDDVNYDRIHKVRILHDEFVHACRRVAKPGRNISLDEAMVKCTGVFV